MKKSMKTWVTLLMMLAMRMPKVSKKRQTNLQSSASASTLLALDLVKREIPEYHGCKRIGPGVLSNIQYLGTSSIYRERSKKLHMNYLVWIELRKLKTHPLLQLPGWTGFFIKVRPSYIIIIRW